MIPLLDIQATSLHRKGSSSRASGNRNASLHRNANSSRSSRNCLAIRADHLSPVPSHGDGRARRRAEPSKDFRAMILFSV